MHGPKRVKALVQSESSSRTKRSIGAENRPLEGEGGLDAMASRRAGAAYVIFYLVQSTMFGSLSPTSLLVVGGLVLTRSSLVHLGLDAVLLSAFLAGVRRTTGLSYAHISPYVHGHLFRLQASSLPSPQQGHSPWVFLSIPPLIHVDALLELLHRYLELGQFYLVPLPSSSFCLR